MFALFIFSEVFCSQLVKFLDKINQAHLETWQSHSFLNGRLLLQTYHQGSLPVSLWQFSFLLSSLSLILSQIVLYLDRINCASQCQCCRCNPTLLDLWLRWAGGTKDLSILEAFLKGRHSIVMLLCPSVQCFCPLFLFLFSWLSFLFLSK